MVCSSAQARSRKLCGAKAVSIGIKKDFKRSFTVGRKSSCIECRREMPYVRHKRRNQWMWKQRICKLCVPTARAKGGPEVLGCLCDR